MMNRIKKALIVTLANISIIGNVTSTPVQARTFPDVAKNAPITKVIDCNDLTVVYGCYSSEADATFIMADIIEKETGSCISTEVTGFYFGEPDFEYTEKYQNT